MDEHAKKTALRMITYGLYVLGVEHRGELAAASINWLTQASFTPPLVVLGVKKDGRTFALLKASRKFAVSFLKSGQRELAFAFFKPARVEDGKIGGYAYEIAETGAPIISQAPAWVEGQVLSIDETGDHAVVVSQVMNAGVKRHAAPLTLKELDLNYGG
ncbi:MAG: flavin reductase family protein [Candidatus Methylomirabilia bacterium]